MSDREKADTCKKEEQSKFSDDNATSLTFHIFAKGMDYRIKFHVGEKTVNGEDKDYLAIGHQ